MDIFPGGRWMDFPDIRLDATDRFSFQFHNLPKSLLRIRHSELDLLRRQLGANC
jgi:hypothetical protein